MKQLSNIIANISTVHISGAVNKAIAAIALDSRAVIENTLFIAIKGTQVDGHLYIAKAIEKGATAILCESIPEEIIEGITYIQVENSASIAGIVASEFYNHPSHQFKLVGVTGTNGKTTVATLLFQLFTQLGFKCGLVSTVENKIGTTVIPSTHTTPDAIALQDLLSQMAQEKCEYVFMEVSSHAAHQGRINGVKFAGALFTNMTHDHLDYHGSFDEYIKAKKIFFDQLEPSAFALINIDDKRGRVLVQNTEARIKSYSLRTIADYKGKVLENNLTGLVLDINGVEAYCSMIGQFNAYNLLCVYGASIELGLHSEQALTALTALKGAEGRFDPILSSKDRVLGIIDYAHTPDALLNVLATILQFKDDQQQLITVIGCGGDRDTTKRPIMAKAACAHSDKVILTSDNPRFENPENILDQMEAGVEVFHRKKVLRITDRQQAIRTACQIAHNGDIILIAGKGHEKYQDTQGVKTPFDDKKVFIDTLNLLER
jgi:UDP-N-acetylmuramoyl-L-alanyl-D-glutamate--2,6-diaminopimelate ligase